MRVKSEPISEFLTRASGHFAGMLTCQKASADYKRNPLLLRGGIGNHGQLPNRKRGRKWSGNLDAATARRIAALSTLTLYVTIHKKHTCD